MPTDYSQHQETPTATSSVTVPITQIIATTLSIMKKPEHGLRRTYTKKNLSQKPKARKTKNDFIILFN